jgi:hypothetical protein
VGPPAANGTTMEIGLAVGYACPKAYGAASRASVVALKVNSFFMMKDSYKNDA